MSDLQLLFLVLACVYTWECACWLRRGSVAFLTWFGRRWRAVHPGTLLGNQNGSLLIAAPLPPLGHVLTGNQFPLSLSADGVLAYVSTNVNPGWRPQQSGRFFRFDEIKAVEVKGKKLLINGESVFKAASPHFATHLARTVRQLLKTAAAERSAAIEKVFRASFDTKAIEKLWAEFQKQTGAMRWLANALLVYLFAIAPAAIWHFSLKLTWEPLLVGLFGLTTAIAVLFRRAHKTFHPEAEDDRFTHFLTILLSPATAIRAQDVLSRPLLENFHPLAIAAVFCPENQFREFARRVLIDVRFPALPVCASAQADAEATERESRAQLQKTVEAFLSRNKLKPEELVRPPKQLDETCRAYCPRCYAQFTSDAATCADCGGLPLQPFAPLRA